MYLCVACEVLKVCFSVLPLPFSIVSVYIVFPSLSFFVPLLYHSCASLSIDRLHNLYALCVPLFVHCATVCLSVCASARISLSVTLSLPVCAAVLCLLRAGLPTLCRWVCLSVPLFPLRVSPRRLSRVTYLLNRTFVLLLLDYCSAEHLFGWLSLSFCAFPLLSATGRFAEHLFASTPGSFELDKIIILYN